MNKQITIESDLLGRPASFDITLVLDDKTATFSIHTAHVSFSGGEWKDLYQHLSKETQDELLVMAARSLL